MIRTASITLVLAAGLLAGTAHAQTGPGVQISYIPAFIITPPASPGSDVAQLMHAKLSNNSDGEWTTALSVGNLPAQYGGDASSQGVAIGIFSPYFGTFITTTQGNALNSTDDDIHINLSPDGLWAIVERKAFFVSTVWLASRAAVGQPFGAPVQVTGFPAIPLGFNLAPALGPVGGSMKVYFSDTSNILQQDIDLQNATLTGSPTIVSGPAQVGTIPSSPTPVIGGDGDVEALLMMDIVVPKSGQFTGDSDPVWANDLDPSTPAVVQVQRSDWQCCGGMAGGFMYFTHDLVPFQHTMHGEVAWIVGDVEPPGGTVDIRTVAPNHSAPNALLSNMLLAGGEMPPFKLGPFKGFLALDAATLTPFVIPFSTSTRDGAADFSFVLPNDPVLSGGSIAIQALVSDVTRDTHTFTNTAWIHVQ